MGAKRVICLTIPDTNDGKILANYLDNFFKDSENRNGISWVITRLAVNGIRAENANIQSDKQQEYTQQPVRIETKKVNEIPVQSQPKEVKNYVEKPVEKTVIKQAISQSPHDVIKELCGVLESNNTQSEGENIADVKRDFLKNFD